MGVSVFIHGLLLSHSNGVCLSKMWLLHEVLTLLEPSVYASGRRKEIINFQVASHSGNGPIP